MRLDGARHPPVQRLARLLQDRLVDRLLHEGMREDVARVSAHGGVPAGAGAARQTADQLAAHQVVEDGVEVWLVAQDLGDDVVLERAADGGRYLQDMPRRLVEAIDAAHHDLLHGAGDDRGSQPVGQPHLAALVGHRPVLDERADHLFDVERIAFRPPDDELPRRVRQIGRAEQVVDERVALRRGEMAKADLGVERSVLGPGRRQDAIRGVGRLRPCQHDEEEGMPAGEPEQRLQQLDRRLVRPVQILEHQYGGTRVGEAPEHAAARA